MGYYLFVHLLFCDTVDDISPFYIFSEKLDPLCSAVGSILQPKDDLQSVSLDQDNYKSTAL